MKPLQEGERTCPGIEPGTSRTQNEKHASRPTCKLGYICMYIIIKVSSGYISPTLGVAAIPADTAASSPLRPKRNLSCVMNTVNAAAAV